MMDEIIDIDIIDLFEVIDVDKDIIEKMKMMLDSPSSEELEGEKNEA